MKWTFTCFLPVHGGWGEWSNHWSECSTTCGLGMRTRERECDNPKPKYGGRPCEEQERQQVKYCRERDCDPGLILRLLLLSFYCMFVAAFPLAEFLCFHTGIKMTIAQLAWEKEIVGDSGTWSQMSPSSTHYEKCFLLNFLFFFFFFFILPCDRIFGFRLRRRLGIRQWLGIWLVGWIRWLGGAQWQKGLERWWRLVREIMSLGRL